VNKSTFNCLAMQFWWIK